MKIFEKIIKIILDIIIILAIGIVIIVLCNFFQVNVFGHKYPDFLGYTFFEVTTGSMSGTMEINDVILVKITNDVHTNDIITYVQNDEIITHRVIEERKEDLITKGDANNAGDMPISKSNVIGKVIKVFPKLGIWFKVFLDEKVIISIFITLILFGIAISTDDHNEKSKEKQSFSKFLRKRRGKKKYEQKEKKKKTD